MIIGQPNSLPMLSPYSSGSRVTLRRPRPPWTRPACGEGPRGGDRGRKSPTGLLAPDSLLTFYPADDLGTWQKAVPQRATTTLAAAWDPERRGAKSLASSTTDRTFLSAYTPDIFKCAQHARPNIGPTYRNYRHCDRPLSGAAFEFKKANLATWMGDAAQRKCARPRVRCS